MYKVCFVGTEITPSEEKTFVGSHVNTILRLSKGLLDLGWEIHVVTSPSRFLRETDFDYSLGKLHLINVRGKYGTIEYGFDFLIKAIKMIETLHRKESFHIVHTHSSYFSMGIIPAYLKKKLGITALHSLYSPARFFPSKIFPKKYGIEFISLGLDKIIAVTNNVKDSLIACGVSADKIQLIPLCVDTDIFNLSILAQEQDKVLQGQSEIQTVLYIGSSEKVKGLDIFLEAAELILKKYSKVKFIITLHEPNECIEKVRILASSKLGSNVQVLGIVNDIPRLIASADVVLVPFRNTNNISDIPLIILEAMAVGRSVVTSNIGGNSELVRDKENGVLVTQNRADLFADAVIHLLRNPNLRKKIGKQASLDIISKYSHKESTRKISKLYQKVIGGSIVRV